MEALWDWSWMLAGLAAVAAAWAADLLARGREDGDSGDYWSWIILVFAAVMGPLLILSAVLPSLSQDLWKSGYHLYLDLQPPRITQNLAYLAALLIPGLFWVALLIAGSLRGRRAVGVRWLAGSAGLTTSRRWVWLYAVPLLALLLLGQADLRQGSESYPAAVWATLLALAASLIAVGASRPSQVPPSPPPHVEEEHLLPGPPPAWNATAQDQGIRLKTLKIWRADPAPRPIRQESARELEERLKALQGAATIAPELIETLGALIERSQFGSLPERARLVLAPDECGQIETVAASSAILWQRYRETTLIICASEAEGLTARLEGCLPAGVQAVWVDSEAEFGAGAALYVVEAEALSERLLRRLPGSNLTSQIGWVVWFDVHRYTGVLAANLWAISRRLNRILTSAGRLDLRILALARAGAYGDAQVERFVRRLLPYTFSAQSEVRIPSQFRREVHLYLIESAEGLLGSPLGRRLSANSRHPAVAAALSAVSQGRSAWLERPREANDVEWNQVMQLSLGDQEVRNRLQPSRCEASVGVFALQAGDALSIAEMLCQGGRASGENVHDEAICPVANPYVGYLLGRLSHEGNGGSGFGTSKRLVGAEAQRSIIKHHLLSALAEHEETGSGLRSAFLWEEDVIRRTLEAIFKEGRLQRREVRFLDGDERLRIDHLYRNRLALNDGARPLDCVGTKLVMVREIAGGQESGGRRMLVDPERLPIQAYPGRVFMHRGRRFRVRHWDDLNEAVQRGWVGCEYEGNPCETLRIRDVLVDRIRSAVPVSTAGEHRRLISRMTAELDYDEQVTGVIDLLLDPETGTVRPQQRGFDLAVSTSFSTQALILRFSGQPDALALVSLCQALRTALPVHLGVEEDAVEVVPLQGVYAGDVEVFGAAIVDLYPGGIGLVAAIRDDDQLIRTLLASIREWLASCDCAVSCPNCLESQSARAVSRYRRPDRKAALKMLEEFAA